MPSIPSISSAIYKGENISKSLNSTLRPFEEESLCSYSSIPTIPIIPDLTLEEFKKTIVNYIWAGKSINMFLRENLNLRNMMRARFIETITNLDNMFARTPVTKNKISLHRVIKVNSNFNPSLNVGDIITDKGYMSCSRNYNQDIFMANGKPLTDGEPIYITVNVPENSKVIDVIRYVKMFGRNYQYNEILINRNSSILVTNKNGNCLTGELLLK